VILNVVRTSNLYQSFFVYSGFEVLRAVVMKSSRTLLATCFMLVSGLAYFSTLKMEAVFLRNVG
jgi:hypothetical protein